MRIALAQTSSVRGDLAVNATIHCRWIDSAAKQEADLVVFPELSLTGYWPALAETLATDQDDRRLDPLQDACERAGCLVAAGLPTRSATGLRISMVVFTPGAPRQTYSKQRIHSDEEPFFEPGCDSVVLERSGLRIVPAICYEALQPEHAAAAAADRAQLYLASVAKPTRNLEHANTYLPDAARRHSMAVTMVNGVGPCEDFTAAGGSAAWDCRGTRLGQLGPHEEGLLVCQIDRPDSPRHAPRDA